MFLVLPDKQGCQLLSDFGIWVFHRLEYLQKGTVETPIDKG
jgi:hypothetical protein